MTAPGSQKQTILVVEDGETVRRLVCNLLNQCGYDVLEAGDGQEAMEVWERHRDSIHLVLTDVLMPRMGGRELARRLQAARPGTRILFMSGYGEDPAVYAALAPLFISKPFTTHALMKKVREVLDAPASEPAM